MVPIIVLSRHGRPVASPHAAIPGTRYAEWHERADHQPIDPLYPPPAALLEWARRCDLLAASPLRRSRESAGLLRPAQPPLIDPLFREVYIPTAIRSRLKLPPRLWGWLARSAWYCGWSPGVESYAAARQRALRAAERLAALAAEHGIVLLAGHGLMNGLIGMWLRRAGWRGPPLRTRRYWSFRVYRGRQGLILPS